MANALDELTDKVSEGRDARVIEKQILITTGAGSVIFQIMLWVLGILPGIIFLFMQAAAKNKLLKIEQAMQHNASQIDNYMEQRVMILNDCAALVSKSIDLDKTTFVAVAAERSGHATTSDARRNEQVGTIDAMTRSLNMVFEQYPELQSHQAIREAMRQNMYLQKEITAARECYNDTVNHWNALVNQWPTYKIVAARGKYTTRVPFAATQEIRMAARSSFFN